MRKKYQLLRKKLRQRNNKKIIFYLQLMAIILVYCHFFYIKADTIFADRDSITFNKIKN